MGRCPCDECSASGEPSRRVIATRDPAICNLFAVAISRKSAPKRENPRISPKFNTLASQRMEVHPKKSDFHPATSIRSSTELATVTPDCHSKQGKLPLRPPTPDPDQRLQDTSSPSAQPPAPEKSNISHTSAIPANDQPLENRINDILRVFGALIRQLHIIRASLNVSKGEYGKIKTHHHKALMVFCTGRCVGWAKEKSKIERRISSVSRVLREDREWERQIVEKLEQLERILEGKGHRVDSWRQLSGLQRWTPG